MSELRSSTSDDSSGAGLAAEAQRHREILRGPVEEYQRRMALQVQYLQPMQRTPMVARADERIADLMIDTSRHRDLDLAAYRAVREGWPARFDSRRQMFVATRRRREVLIGPHSAERRLGIVARLAANGVELEQILLVASVVIAHPAGPGAAVIPPVRAAHDSAAAVTATRPRSSAG